MGEPTGPWTLLAVGEAISRSGGQRVALRPAGGSAAVTLAWSGSALEELSAVSRLARLDGELGLKSWGRDAATPGPRGDARKPRRILHGRSTAGC